MFLVTQKMVREAARTLDLWSDDTLREEIDADQMARLVLEAANRASELPEPPAD